MGRPETVPTSVQCTIGSLNKSLNFLFDHVIPKSLAKTGRGNIWSKIKEQNPPRLSNGSVIAAPAGGAVTLSRLPFHISDRRREEGAGSEPHNGFDGHRMSVLMARPADSPGGDMHRCQWSLKIETSRPVAWGFRQCTELQQPLIRRLFWVRSWNLGQGVLVPCEAEKRIPVFV